MNPFLKWAGGKRWIANFCNDIFNEKSCNAVVEPFCGAGAVTLRIQPEFAILNDNNVHLINLWNQVKDNGLPVDISVDNTKENFLSIREDFNKRITLGDVNTPLMAQYFYFLNKTCFNGLSRFNKLGFFNVGFGKYKKPTLLMSFYEYQNVIENYNFVNLPFLDVISSANNKKTFLFVDPPYFKTFGAYSGTAFTLEDQLTLANSLRETIAPTIATNSFEPEIIEAYKEAGFKVFCYMARRTISRNGQREKVKEMIAFKNIDTQLVIKLSKKHKIEIFEIN